MLLDWRQRAIFPSSRSKIAPKNGNQSANQAYFGFDVMRKRPDMNNDCAPQNPFINVNASARWKLLAYQ